MAKVKIKRNRCKGCQLCIAICPKKNIKLDTEPNEIGVFPALIVSEEDCTGCGLCYVVCPDVCFEIEGD